MTENLLTGTKQIKPNKNKTKLCSGPASSVHIFNVLTLIMQSLNIKEWNLFELQIHTNKQRKQSKGGVDVIMSKFNNPKNIIKCAQNIGCTHVQCVSNHNILSLNMKERILLESQIKQTKHPLSISDGLNI